MLTGYFQRNFILIVRYLMVGVLIYTIDMLSFVFSFYLLGLNELIANGFAKILAGILGFLLQKKFTFKINKNKDNAIQKYRYITLLFSTVLISVFLFYFILMIIRNPVVAKFISDILIVILSFLISKQWVFPTENKGG